MAKPYIANIEPLIQAGIDPKTGLPVKLGTGSTYLKQNIKRQLQLLDRTESINRYTWENLPEGITSELIERIIYFKGQVIIFKLSDDKFYVLPYTLAGNIDCYGRYRQVTPVPFAGTGTEDNEPWIKGLIKVPVYSEEDIAEVSPEDACVIIRDYSPGVSQTIISRDILSESIIDVEAECIPLLRTALINSTGVSGIRVGTEGESESVLDASRAIENAAITGNRYVPIIGNLDFQDLANGNLAKAEEFMLSMQSLDNFRLQTAGITSGGLFEKKAHELQDEANLNSNPSNIVLDDGLKCRQDAADLLNKIFALNITVNEIEQEQQEDAALYEESDEEEEIVDDSLQS